jgi:hypothetical protein
MKLFAVYLGGRAPKANIELHDMVFVVGDRIEDTYIQLLDKWFGAPERLHIDSWMALDVVDGWRITLSDTPAPAAPKLWFVNLGAYREGDFTELHAVSFHVAAEAPQAKAAAMARHFTSGVTEAHKDDLLEVDDLLALERVGDLYVVLTHTGETSTLKANNGYQIIPKDVVKTYLDGTAFLVE